MKKVLSVAALALALALLATGCRTPADPGAGADSSVKEAPTGDNSLHWWGMTPVKYDAMPTEAQLTRLPWPGDYWATFRGGIAYRWQTPINGSDYKKFLVKIPTAAELAALTEANIAKLSPAEKYDLWMGRTDLSSETSVTGSQRAFMLQSATFNREQLGKDEIPGWTGICNGWSLAAINEPQPMKPVTVTAESGKKITFYPGDIKALMSQIYFDYQPLINVARLGVMCTEPQPATTAAGRIKDASCRDVNPMSFHAALALQLAKDKPFVFDVESADEVWNQPAYGYKVAFKNKRNWTSTYRNAAAGTKKLVDVTADFRYIVEAHPEKVGLTPAQLKEHVKTVRYEYTLELDANDLMLGGEWKAGTKIPDFLWRPDERPSDEILARLDGYPLSYAKVKELLDLAAAP